MPSSMSVARATATLPRHWSKPVVYGQTATVDPRMRKRQEGANKTRLILQSYLKRGIDPSPELLDSLDPTNLSYEGTISSVASNDSIRVTLASEERRRLLKKQTRRQSVLPSFFEPLSPMPPVPPLPPMLGKPVALTAAALTEHDHPAMAFLAAPVRAVRRVASFAGAMPTPPIIRIIKPEPECLDDHSNPSSRDPFYYQKWLDNDVPASPRQRQRSNSKVNQSGRYEEDSVGSDAVTSWFADQYLRAPQDV